MSNFDRATSRCVRLTLLAGCLLGACFAQSTPPTPTMMPLPTTVEYKPGRLAVTPAFSVAFRGPVDARLSDGLARLLQRVQERSGLTFAHLPAGGFALAPDAAGASLVIECADPGAAVPVLGEDESYTLDISSTQAVLRASTGLGVLRGYATLQQLLQPDPGGWSWPAVTIRDQPRFPGVA